MDNSGTTNNYRMHNNCTYGIAINYTMLGNSMYSEVQIKVFWQLNLVWRIMQIICRRRMTSKNTSRKH